MSTAAAAATPISDKDIESPTSASPAAVPSSLPNVPDGGWRAWLQIFAAALTLFASFGVVSCRTRVRCISPLLADINHCR